MPLHTEQLGGSNLEPSSCQKGDMHAHFASRWSLSDVDLISLPIALASLMNSDLALATDGFAAYAQATIWLMLPTANAQPCRREHT